jgi:selenocysteine lyase/cysteine desulfurase
MTLKRQLQQLIHAPSVDDIALVKNTSEALSFVANGIAWTAGDNIVTTDAEFPSNRIVWEALADHGVILRPIPLRYDADPEAQLIAACDDHTRLLTVSSIAFGTGFRLDLPRLGRFCKQENILFCVDAIQSIGAVDFDVQAVACDFAMADGHKWMLGPEGLGVFFTTPAARDTLRISEYGWHMIENAGDFDDPTWRIARSARRYECGSPNMLGIVALSASLSVLLEAGIANISRTNIRNSLYLLDALVQRQDFTVISPIDPDRLGGIVTFKPVRADAKMVVDDLRRVGIVCACRAGGIRFSPHFYIAHNSLDSALAELFRCVPRC